MLFRSGIENIDFEALINNVKVIEFITKRINDKQQNFASFEQVKRFTLLSTPFSMDKGELTNTLKIKRSVVNEHYAKQIDDMYK